MEEPETQTHSFVLRFWLEEIEAETGQSLWRGHLTHVASGKRHYLQSVEELPHLIAPYLEEPEGPADPTCFHTH